MNIGTVSTTTNQYKNRKKFRSYLVSDRFLLCLIKILASDTTIMRRQLINIKRFLDVIDRDFYFNDNHLEAMIIVCDSLLLTKTKLGTSLKLEDIIFNINLLLPDDEYEEVKNNLIIPQIKLAKTDSIETELSYVSESLDQNLKWSYILDTKDDLYDLTSDLTTCSYKDFPTVLDKYRNLLTNIMNFFRGTDNSSNLGNIVHTSDPTFYDFLHDTYEAIRNPASALQTGWLAMNSALGPRGGFQNKNLYLFNARTNSFKSALLLHFARMLKEYNAAKLMDEYKTTGKIPTILFIELENDFDEDSERLYKIVSHKDIGKCTSKEELFSSWKHTFDADKENNPIDISFVHADSRSISVDDVEKIKEILEEENYKVKAILIDYIGIMKPRQEDIGKELRIQLKNIAEDLLSLAKSSDIPVIAAHQLNRSGDTILANIKMQGGANAVSQLTNEYIGESFGIVQAASWSMFIDIEIHEGRKFLTCKRSKCRYSGKYGLEYFVLEIKDGIIIEDDIYAPKPLYFEAIPNTEVNQTNSTINSRGTTDIRDKNKSTQKGNILDIVPKETQVTNKQASINLKDLIPPEKWFDFIGTYDIEEIMEYTDYFEIDNCKTFVLGETEYVIQQEEYI